MKCKTVKLGDYLYIKGRIGWKGLKKSEYLDAGEFRIINGETLTEDGINWEKAGYITQERYDESPEIMLQEEDILISKDGTIGKIGYVDKLESPTTVASGIFLIRNEQPDILDTRFVYYFLRSPYFRAFIEMRTEGSVIPHLYQKDFVDLDFPLFDIDVQRKVASLLNTLDEKISLNKKINDNLQQQAQAIFSEWQQTYTTSATVVSLADVCEKVTDGSHFSPKDDPASHIPMLSVKDMGEFDFDFSSCKHISQSDYQKMIANDCVPQIDDILVAKDGSYLKEIFICNQFREIAILSSIAIFRPNKNKIFPEILLAFLKSPAVLREARDNYVSGSALPRIVLKDFKKLNFSLPSLEKQFEISGILSDIRQIIDLNVRENQRLQSLRDTLLPKLMSGELDVSALDI